jgi:hypothetical protein
MSIHVCLPAVDLLAQAVEQIRPHLKRSLPIGQRARNFWAAAVAARDLGAADVVEEELMQLAGDTGLTAELGKADVTHLIRSAFRDQNPFS